MNDPIKPPVSVVDTIDFLARSLKQGKVEYKVQSNEIEPFDDEHAGVRRTLLSPVHKWMEIGGIRHEQAGMLLSEFVTEFEAMKAERDQLRFILQQIAKTAKTAGGA